MTDELQDDRLDIFSAVPSSVDAFQRAMALVYQPVGVFVRAALLAMRGSQKWIRAPAPTPNRMGLDISLS